MGHHGPSENWKYGHNYMHHTYTNIVGKDRDVGYGILRMDEDQPWRPYYLGNPVYAFLLMMFFEWGVTLHDLETEDIIAGRAHLGGEQGRSRRASCARSASRCSRTTSSSRR